MKRKMKKKSKILSILLSLILVLSLVPTVAFAEGGAAATPISSIAVTITAPALGATPDTNPSFITDPGGDTLELRYTDWYKIPADQYDAGDSWEEMDTTETFTTGYYYSPYMEFVAKNGYELDAAVTATVNG